MTGEQLFAQKTVCQKAIAQKGSLFKHFCSDENVCGIVVNDRAGTVLHLEVSIRCQFLKNFSISAVSIYNYLIKANLFRL